MTGTTAQCKATARPATLSAASRLAVVLSRVAQEIGDLEHHPPTVLRLVGAAILLFLRLRFATFLQKP